MKMMIALRWISTPMTPTMKSAAVSARDSASTGRPPSSQDDRTSDRHQQKHARQLEGEQVLSEQRFGDHAHGVQLLELLRIEVRRDHELRGKSGAQDDHDQAEKREPDEP